MNEIIVNTTELFHELTCEKGHYITAYHEEDDILTFSASKLMYCPLNTDLSKYHCITDEEYNILSGKKQIAENIKESEMAMNFSIAPEY